jgi:hypothetical protein
MLYAICHKSVATNLQRVQNPPQAGPSRQSTPPNWKRSKPPVNFQPQADETNAVIYLNSLIGPYKAAPLKPIPCPRCVRSSPKPIRRRSTRRNKRDPFCGPPKRTAQNLSPIFRLPSLPLVWQPLFP